ncbi:MAG: DUF4197 domain-containing protein, partial [Planctomycetota bacterium]
MKILGYLSVLTFMPLMLSCETIEGLDLASIRPFTVSEGLKEALEKGTRQAVDHLARSGGYSENTLYRLTVPESLETFTSVLRRVGYAEQVDAFEAKMNEAAEAAAARAAPIFLESIGEMTLEDANSILMGHETAITDYFRRTAGPKLKADYLPIVRAKMDEIGSVAQFNSLVD